jgi:hypothetical protein
MITGTHVLFYSEKPEADREFFRDVLRFNSVDAGGGWLIFALPPGEAGIHPAEGAKPGGRSPLGAAVYLMCDDLPTEMKRLQARKVSFSPVEKARWGSKTMFRLPGGAEVGLYQPSHPTAIGLKTK